MFDWAKKFFGAQAKAASGDDPRTGSGWDIVEGILNGLQGWMDADEIWSQRAVRDLETVVKTQLLVYVCITKLAATASEAPLRVGSETGDGWKDQPDHPLQELFNAPNSLMSNADLTYHAIAHLMLTGESYIWKWRNAAGFPFELWPVPTSWVKPEPNGWSVYQGANKPRQFVPSSDMVVTFLPDPTNPKRGLSPLRATLKDVQLDDERTDYTMEMLVNTPSPGMIFSQPESWEPEQMDDVRKRLSSGLRRGKRGLATFISGEGVKAEAQTPMKDLDWKGLSNLGEARVCAAFGVPPILVGLRVGLESATYSNYEVAEKAFYRGTMSALWKRLDGAFTRGFIIGEPGMAETGIEVYCDTTGVRGLREEADKIAARAGQMLSSGIITRNEAREMCELEALDDAHGNVFLLPMNLIEIPADGTAPNEAPPKDNGSGNQGE